MTIYLYKKTHNITGLKYLGKTISPDPHKYKGSGEIWIPHIKKHGYDVTTEILKECQTTEELKHWGLYYSELWDVVNSRDCNGRKIWANLRPESGDGGAVVTPWNKGIKTGPQSPEIKEKRSKSMKGKPAHNKGVPNPSISLSNKKRLTGVPRSEKDKEAISKGGKGKKMATITCPHCMMTGGRGNMNRYHFENCKYITKKINT
jgi:hypothetical protein